MVNEYNLSDERALKYDCVEADVVVVGAGIAGITAALTAARQGRKTVLVTDRPILGGSASSEVRVGPGGADSPPWNRFARETGIVEEIFNHVHYRASFSGKWRWFYFDQIYFDLVYSEPNIECYLNTTIFKVNKSDASNISSVEGIQLRSERRIEFKAEIFIDCSGDGTIGYLAGADYRIGRESKAEFNETHAPEIEDKGTMGATLLFTSVNTGHPTKFKAPAWAIDIRTLPSFPRLSRSINKMPDGTYYGFWWAEYGGQLDSIHDDDKIIYHLRQLVYGIWDYIKNSGEFADVENLEMNWMGYLPGKRESRRLMGPYIAAAHDFMQQKVFEDTIGFTGWPMDIHPPEGYLTMQPGCTHDYLPGITDIPFRCIYSRNISNLMFAGRHISATHEGLGTLRLIPTTAVMGQAAGMAAAMCIEKKVLPGNIYKSCMPELQKRLAQTDQSIIGYRLNDEKDFSRKAIVTASSERNAENTKKEHFLYMNKVYGLILPVETEKLDTLSVYLSSDKAAIVQANVYVCDGKPQNYRPAALVKTVSAECSTESWYEFDIGATPGPGKKLIITFNKNPNVKIYFSHEMFTGILGIEANTDGELKRDTIYREIGGITAQSVFTPCFKISPVQRFYRAENINNGYIRPYGLPNLWSSADMKPHVEEWIKLSFDSIKTISSVELVFNSELNHKRLQPTINKVNTQMVKSYKVTATTPNGEVVIAEENENFIRFRKHSFEPVQASAVKLTIYETWGGNSAEVYDFRVY